MPIPDRPDGTPRTFGYDNNHILFAVLIIFGVLAGIWYVYGSYRAPQNASAITSDVPAPGIAKTPLTSTSPVAAAPASTTPSQSVR